MRNQCFPCQDEFLSLFILERFPSCFQYNPFSVSVNTVIKSDFIGHGRKEAPADGMRKDKTVL